MNLRMFMGQSLGGFCSQDAGHQQAAGILIRPVFLPLWGASMQFHSGQILSANRRAIDIYSLEQEHQSIAEHVVVLVAPLLSDDDEPN